MTRYRYRRGRRWPARFSRPPSVWMAPGSTSFSCSATVWRRPPRKTIADDAADVAAAAVADVAAYVADTVVADN